MTADPVGVAAASDISADEVATDALGRLLSTRWSCRAFLPQPIPREELDRVLDIARRTPSWCNTQPWHIDITTGSATDALRDALHDAISQGSQENPDIEFPTAYEGVYRDRRRTSGWQLYESLGIAKGDRAASARQTLRNFDFFDAPHVAVVTTERALGTYGAVDCGLFVNNFLLAAHSRGIGTIPQAALATQAPVLRDYFGYPDNRLVLLGISLGYPDLDDPVNVYRTERQEVGDIATFHDGPGAVGPTGARS
ncbi:nitroreductase [Gordonia polyisoprenivorans]|uniref:nitroreductase n=1 Tax=Gordonia polyisoprenivorans TaxID=84595 RepID=UPI001AD741AF|nr:nitroreductase [Gordonia polyisoprenivorans]QTI70863.1 nitroreductase [Gordonia polyisoprenivorans]